MKKDLLLWVLMLQVCHGNKGQITGLYAIVFTTEVALSHDPAAVYT